MFSVPPQPVSLIANILFGKISQQKIDVEHRKPPEKEGAQSLKENTERRIVG